MSDQTTDTIPAGAPHRPEPGLGHVGVRVGILIAMFAAGGLVFTSTMVRLPELQAAFELDYSALGLVLLAPAVAGLLTAPWMPRITARFGGLRTAGLAMAAWGLAGLPIAWTAPNLWLLVPVLAVWGALFVAVDIAVNVTVTGIERATGRFLLSRAHAAFSAAGAIGALAGGAAAQAGVSLFAQFVIAAALFTAVSAIALVGAALLDALDHQSAPPIAGETAAEPAPLEPTEATRSGTPFSRWWPLVAICLCALMAEGSVANWSAVGLTGLGATPLIAGAGLAAFSAAMFVGRMSGDAVIARLGHVGSIRIGTALAALGGGAGLGAAHLLGDPLLGVAGFAAFGLGLSVAFPATLALAGSRATDDERATAIALAAQGGYIGVAVGPPLIGAIAQYTSVSAALLTLPALTAVALLLSMLGVPRVPRAARRPAPLPARAGPDLAAPVPGTAGEEDWALTFARRPRRGRSGPAALVALVAAVAVLITLLVTGQFDTLLPGGGAAAAPPPSAPTAYSARTPAQGPAPIANGPGLAAPPARPATSAAIPSVAALIDTADTPGYVEVTPDGRQAWIAHREQGFISVLDLTLGAVVTTIPSPAGPPQFIAFCPPGTPGAGRAYVSIYTMRDGLPDDNAPHVVSVIDARTLTPVGDPIPVGRRPYASSCSPDGTTLAVPSHDDARLDLVDTATATLRTSIPVEPNPHWAAHDQLGHIWVANHDNNAVTRVNAQTLAIGEGDVVPNVGVSPHAVAVSPDSTRVAVVSFDSNELRLFDTTTREVLATYPVGQSPQDVAWTADGARLLTTDVIDDRVSVIDAATGQITATLTPPLGQPETWDGPTSVAITPDGTTAVVTLLNTGAVAVLDLTAA
jgi:DNA-binding beta-propeller fold protein YncE/predicted MFS family arabinose efflux permease